MKKVLTILTICALLLAFSGVFSNLLARVSRNHVMSQVLSVVVPVQAYADSTFGPDPKPPPPPLP